MNTRRWLLAGTLLFLAPRLLAQAAPAAPKAPAPVTLTDALRTLPAGSVLPGTAVLSVDAAKVVLLTPEEMARSGQEALPEGVPETPSSLAAEYGRTGRVFGHVFALAPSTMTVLNTDPNLASLPLGALAGQHPEMYLLGTLTPAQFRQVAGTGLAWADMTADQQSLMRALLPEPLDIVPVTATLPGRGERTDAQRKAVRAVFDAQIKHVSGEALYGSLRLHAYLTADFYVHAGSGYGIGDTRDTLQTTGAYELPFGGYGNTEARGKPLEPLLRAEVANTPKAGDLAWNRKDLEAPVTLRGAKTVQEMVARLGAATHLELYADARYEPRPLTLAGDVTKPQTAGEVMQALALCVCGTWRQVGPAYVLTDDVQGLGARQEFLSEMGQIWANRLTEAGKNAGQHLQTLDWLHRLSFAPGDLGTLSPKLIDTIQKQDGTNKGSLPWGSLPPDLREHLRDYFEHFGDNMDATMPVEVQMGNAMKTAAASVKPDTPVDTTVNIRLGVELPDTGVMMLDAYSVQSPKPDSKPDTEDTNAAGPVSPLVFPQALRGLLCAPKTPEEARAVVAQLPKMGLNALLIDVFTNGRTYFPNTALPPDSKDAGSVLQAALDAAKPLHLPVYAVVDTFCWRKDGRSPHPLPWPTGYREDLTLSGETPSQVIQRRFAAGSLMTNYNHASRALAEDGGRGWANPLDPRVRTMLPSLVRTLAASPGLAGLIFQDTAPPGYAKNFLEEDGIGLGYALENRLAYLRWRHQDPVDLSRFGLVSIYVGSESFSGSYNSAVAGFNVSSKDEAAWSKYRAGADMSLLADCWNAAHAAAPLLPLRRREGFLGNQFDFWRTPTQKSTLGIIAEGDDPVPAIGSQSLLTIGYSGNDQVNPAEFLRRARAAAQQKEGHRVGGVVFDLVTGGSPEHLSDTIDKLAGLLTEPKKAP